MSKNSVFAQLVLQLKMTAGMSTRVAEKVAFSIIKGGQKSADLLIHAIQDVVKKVSLCVQCCNLSEQQICSICSDPHRNMGYLCIVENIDDVIAVEKSASFRGLYHVLLGHISPMDGVGPEQLTIDKCLSRIKTQKKIREVIIATNPTSSGDVTATYIMKKIQKEAPQVEVSRIGFGVPIGSSLTLSDVATIRNSIQNRTKTVVKKDNK